MGVGRLAGLKRTTARRKKKEQKRGKKEGQRLAAEEEEAEAAAGPTDRAAAAAAMLQAVLAEEKLEHVAECIKGSHLDNRSIAFAEDDDVEDFDIPMAVGKRLRAGLRRHMGHPPLPEPEPDAEPEPEAGRSNAERKRAKRERHRMNKRLAEEQPAAKRTEERAGPEAPLLPL